MTFRSFILPSLLLLCSGFAKADNFDAQVSSVILLTEKPVQREIGLSEAQRARMNKYADAHRAKLKAYYEQLKKTNGKIDQRKLVQLFAVMKNGVIAQLNPAQLRRLRELSLQMLDFVALADDQVANKVGLTESEKKRVRTVIQAGLVKANDIRNKAIEQATADLRNRKPKTQKEADAMTAEVQQKEGAAIQRISPEIESLQLRTKTQAMAVLTNAERAKWEDLLGKPFKMPRGG